MQKDGAGGQGQVSAKIAVSRRLVQVFLERAANYLKEMSFHAGISSFIPVFLLQTGLFFLPFATIFPRLQ